MNLAWMNVKSKHLNGVSSVNYPANTKKEIFSYNKSRKNSSNF